MVAPNLNLLQAIAKQPQATMPGAPDKAASAENGRKFAKLMNDSRDDQAVRDRKATYETAAPVTEVSSNEVDTPPAKSATYTNDTANNSGTSCSMSCIDSPRPLPPVKAAALLGQFDGMTAAEVGLDESTFNALKDQLQAIVDSDTPATEAEIFASITGTDADKIQALLNAPSTQEIAAAHYPKLAALQHALHQLKEAAAQPAPTEQAAAVISGPLLVNLQEEIAALPANGAKEEDVALSTETMTEITPLANLAVIPANELSGKVETKIATAAPTEAVSAIDVSATRTIDQMIPPLALVKDDKKPALPEVELPKAAHAAAKPEAVDEAKASTYAPSALTRQLEALDENRPLFASGLIKEEQPVKAGEVKAPTVDANAIAPAGAAANLTGAQAVTGVSTVASNLINHAPVREQVQVAVTKAAKDGMNEITIQLDPLGLGRVEVKMHVAQDGKTNIAFLVDKPETFDALSRDARGLERSLQEAGLKADTGGMQFNLRQQPNPQMQSGMNDSRGGGDTNYGPNAPKAEQSASNTAAAPTTRNYRVDIRDGIDIHA